MVALPLSSTPKSSLLKGAGAIQVPALFLWGFVPVTSPDCAQNYPIPRAGATRCNTRAESRTRPTRNRSKPDRRRRKKFCDRPDQSQTPGSFPHTPQLVNKLSFRLQCHLERGCHLTALTHCQGVQPDLRHLQARHSISRPSHSLRPSSFSRRHALHSQEDPQQQHQRSGPDPHCHPKKIPLPLHFEASIPVRHDLPQPTSALATRALEKIWKFALHLVVV